MGYNYKVGSNPEFEKMVNNVFLKGVTYDSYRKSLEPSRESGVQSQSFAYEEKSTNRSSRKQQWQKMMDK